MTTDQALLEADEATSPDGRHFRFKVANAHAYPPGQFVSLRDSSGETRLGQINQYEVDKQGELTATGQVLRDRRSGRKPEQSVNSIHLRSRRASRLRTAWNLERQSPRGARGRSVDHGSRRLGRSDAAPFQPAHLLVRPERLWKDLRSRSTPRGTPADTELPMIIFDPNADFVRLNDIRDDAQPAAAEALARRDLRILRPGDQADESPRVRFTALGLWAKAAVLRLDPLIDRVEYNTLLHLEEVLSTRDVGRVLPELRASNDPALNDIALRIENLGLMSWEIWAGDKRSAVEIIDSRPAATVLDLGGFKFKEEPLVVHCRC